MLSRKKNRNPDFQDAGEETYIDQDWYSKRRRRGPIVALMILIVLALGMGVLALRVALHGKSMRSTMPHGYLPQLTQPGQTNSIEKIAEIDGDVITCNGKRYRFNDDVATFLLLGIDRESPEGYTEGDYHVMAFSDAVLLAAMDFRNDKISFFTVSRDTICEYTKISQDGSSQYTATGQLAIPFSYGDGKEKSLELTKNAVSGLFGNLPIYSCSAMYLDGLGELNDAVGGVTLTPIETIDSKSAHLVKGERVTLNAKQAERYIRYREQTETGNLLRMERQKHYFKALMTQVLQASRENPATVLSVYNAIRGDVVSDLDLSDVIYLAARARKMEVNGDVMSVPGSVTLSEDNYAEFHIDEEGCFELLLRIYYEEMS